MAKGQLKAEFQEMVQTDDQNDEDESKPKQSMRDKFKSLLSNPGRNTGPRVRQRIGRSRKRKTFKLKSVDETVAELGEQIINPTKTPSIASNEVEFFKKNATTSLFQQPINMCNLAAVTIGLRSINIETNLDEIFEICENQTQTLLGVSEVL